MKKVGIIFLLIFILTTLKSANYTVITTADGGNGSLRYALQMCMATAGPHTITFNISTSDAGFNPATNSWTITPATNLPMIMQSDVTIDGSSQPNGNPLGPSIIIDGNNTLDYGLRIFNAANVSLKGLNIRRCTKGIQVYNSPSCIVSGCYIGTDETATIAMSNDIGLEFIAGSHYALIGGNTPTARNIISGNQHIGIRLLDVHHCTVEGNFIGTNRSGTDSIPNYDGMSMEGVVTDCIIGGTTANERNIISGNTDYGLPLFGVGATRNIIIGNFIGTDVTGNHPLGNTYGVLFDDGSFGNRVGGSTENERNIISGNVGYGVFFYNNGTNNNTLINNYIGTDVSGISAIPNTAGIIIDGISFQNMMDGNIISGNLQAGIGINITGSDSNVIVRNRIGINADGQPLPNGMDGIRISQGACKTVIGGMPEEANIIAHNGGAGVYITNDNCKRNLISCNSFYNNGGLAIDLFEPGINHNDAGDTDNGANDKLNYPEISSVSLTSNGFLVSGTLNVSAPQNCIIQLYQASADNFGHGEGRNFLTTVVPASDGSWSITLPNSATNDLITALTIDDQKNTSEFSTTVGSNGPINITENASPQLQVWPNPTSGKCHLRLLSSSIEDNSAEIKLVDPFGREIMSLPITTTTIDLSSLSSGIYFIQFKNSSGKVITQKIILQ